MRAAMVEMGLKWPRTRTYAMVTRLPHRRSCDSLSRMKFLVRRCRDVVVHSGAGRELAPGPEPIATALHPREWNDMTACARRPVTAFDPRKEVCEPESGGQLRRHDFKDAAKRVAFAFF